MKKLTLIFGIVITLVLGIIMLNPIQEQIETVSMTTEEVEGDVYSISSASFHTLLLTDENNLYMWGDNEGLSLNNISYDRTRSGEYEVSTYPRLLSLPFNETIKDISTGETNVGVLTVNNNLYMWGEILHDSGIIYSYDNPYQVIAPNNETIKSFSLGYGHTGFITEEGNLYMFGWNYRGKLGLGDEIDRENPTLVTIPNNETPKELYLSSHNSYLITEEGNLFAWGFNGDGQLGNGSGTAVVLNNPTLITIPNNEKPLKLFTTNNTTGIGLLTVEGNFYIWGNGRAIPDDTQDDINVITEYNLPNNESVKYFYPTNIGGLLLTENNKLYSWGLNINGELGIGDDTITSDYTLNQINIPNNENIIFIDKNINNAGFITDNNHFYRWGYNYKHPIGNESETPYIYSPSLIDLSYFNNETILGNYTYEITVVNEAPYIKLLAILPMVLVAGLVVLTTLGVKKEYN